jgi:hypothetical protein
MSFRAAAAIAFLVFAANAAVSPLYRIYQAQFGFSATTLTLLFAVYPSRYTTVWMAETRRRTGGTTEASAGDRFRIRDGAGGS